MNDYIKKKIKEFELWCEDNTATFGSDGTDDYNISFNSLDFYDKLVERHTESLQEAYKRGVEDALGKVRTIYISWSERTDGRDDSYDDAFLDGTEVMQSKTIESIKSLLPNQENT